jgi:hypothetical protein
MPDLKATIIAQYLAALEMLKQAIEQCPDGLWNVDDSKNKFWHTAYHVLFYTHLYLQPAESDFTPWYKHRPEARSLAQEDSVETGTPYSRGDVLEYLAFCQEEVVRQVRAVDLHAESGFHWLPFDKIELQFYNIRHIQQHTGELFQQLLEESIELHWVGTKPVA